MVMLSDLESEKKKLQALLDEKEAEFKEKAAGFKAKLKEISQRIERIDSEIFQRTEGFFAKCAREVATRDPKFMALVQAEIQKAELEASTKPAGAKKGRPKTKELAKA